MITPPASVSGNEPVEAAGEVGERCPEQRNRDEGQPEPERVDDQEERAGQRLRAERGQRERRREIRADAWRPAETEDDADQERAEHAATAEALGELEAAGALEHADPDHTDDRESEEDHRNAADDLDDATAHRPVCNASDASAVRPRSTKRR